MKLRNLCYALPVLAASPVFAALDADTSEAITSMQTAATDVIGAVRPVVITILTAVLGIAAIWVVYRWVRRALGR